MQDEIIPTGIAKLKAEQSLQIKKHTEEFLKSGKIIRHIPPGVSADDSKKNRSRDFSIHRGD